jgi:hypothetical protein
MEPGSQAVPFNPLLRPGRLRLRAGELPGALGLPGAVRLRYSRTGLWLIARWLGEGAEVLLPDLLCSEALNPFVAAGVGVERYRVGPQLEADPQEIDKAITARTRAVMLVTFFGLPQPFDAVRALCRDRGLVLIDDSAHSALSEQGGRPFGTMGDLGVVSARKTLPVPDGGVLLTGNTDGIPVEARPGRSERALTHFLVASIGWNLELLARTDILGSRARHRAAQPSSDEAPVAGPLGWSRLTEGVARRLDGEREREVRRKSFAAWPALLEGSGARPVIAGPLAPGIAPSGFPVRVDDAERLSSRMRELRTGWITWPDEREVSAEFPGGLAWLPTHGVPRTP